MKEILDKIRNLHIPIQNNETILLRDKNFILEGKVIYQTEDNYYISCHNYPFLYKEVVLCKKKE